MTYYAKIKHRLKKRIFKNKRVIKKLQPRADKEIQKVIDSIVSLNLQTNYEKIFALAVENETLGASGRVALYDHEIVRKTQKKRTYLERTVKKGAMRILPALEGRGVCKHWVDYGVEILGGLGLSASHEYCKDYYGVDFHMVIKVENMLLPNFHKPIDLYIESQGSDELPLQLFVKRSHSNELLGIGTGITYYTYDAANSSVNYFRGVSAEEIKFLNATYPLQKQLEDYIKVLNKVVQNHGASYVGDIEKHIEERTQRVVKTLEAIRQRDKSKNSENSIGKQSTIRK